MSAQSHANKLRRALGLSLALSIPLVVSQAGCPVREDPADAAIVTDASAASDSSTETDAGSDDGASTHSDAASQSDSASNVQDAARRDAGAGGLTIYDIRDPSSASHPAVDSEVSISNVVVTAIDDRPNTTGFWVQESSGGPFSGVFVFVYSDSTVFSLASLHIGDVVSLSGTYTEYYEQSQININNGSAEITGSHAPLPAANPAGFDSNSEPWEGVLVHFSGPCNVTSDPNQYGQVTTSCITLDDDIWAYGDALSSGMTLNQINGVVVYSFGEYKLLPRDAADLGLSGGSDAGTAYDSGSSSGCGNIDYQGECNGNSITYCYEGELFTEDCVAEYGNQATCGLLDCTGADCLGYYCIATAGGPCTEIDCDLTHGCIGGVCTDSTTCDDSYDDVCVADSTRLSYCHPFSNLVNEMDCALDVYGDPADFICGQTSQNVDACLGTVGTWNCDLTQTPAEECAPGLVCSSDTMLGDCQDPNAGPDAGLTDAANAVDAGPAHDATIEDAGVEDSSIANEDAGAEDAGVEDAA